MNQSIWKNRIICVSSLVGVIVFWSIMSRAINKSIILPKPLETVQSIIHIVKSKDFYHVLNSTIVRTLISFFASLILGVLFAMIAGINSTIESIIFPIITILRTVPTMAVIILSLIWLGGEISPIFISFLVTFPIVYMNVLKGVQGVNKKLLEMAHLYNVPRGKIIKQIYFHSIVPYLIAAINSALGLGFKVTVAAEVMGDTKFSIGKKLQLARLNLNMSEVFGWAIILIIIVIIFDIMTNQMTKLLK